jgi:hypothetical protein
MTYENRDDTTTTVYDEVNNTSVDVDPWELLENLISNLPLDEDSLEELDSSFHYLRQRTFELVSEQS